MKRFIAILEAVFLIFILCACLDDDEPIGSFYTNLEYNALHLSPNLVLGRADPEDIESHGFYYRSGPHEGQFDLLCLCPAGTNYIFRDDHLYVLLGSGITEFDMTQSDPRNSAKLTSISIPDASISDMHFENFDENYYYVSSHIFKQENEENPQYTDAYVIPSAKRIYFALDRRDGSYHEITVDEIPEVPVQK